MDSFWSFRRNIRRAAFIEQPADLDEQQNERRDVGTLNFIYNLNNTLI